MYCETLHVSLISLLVLNKLTNESDTTVVLPCSFTEFGETIAVVIFIGKSCLKFAISTFSSLLVFGLYSILLRGMFNPEYVIWLLEKVSLAN